MFSKSDLKKLIIPLVIEQFLAVTVGMADTMMISRCGEAAISGIALVDAINILVIGLFSALATGGAVVAAQFIGHKEPGKACQAADQLFLAIAGVSTIFMGVALILNHQILSLIYGGIEADVMRNARIYFYITAASFPFIALYNAGAALFRAMGNSKVSMKVSLWMNIINVVGNGILIWGLHMEVAGAGIATLVSRVMAAVMVMMLLRNKEHIIHIKGSLKVRYEPKMVARILRIGIPNGLENSIFQLGKILVVGLIATYGEVGIAANSVANTISSFAVIPGSAIGLAMITVVGQCVGAMDLKQVKHYTKRLLMITYIALFALNVAVLLLLEPICALYHLSDATAQLARELTIYHSICCMVIWPASFTLPNALRAANDVKFTMIVSISSMWIWRIAFSYVLAKACGLGVLGVWIAMTIDWAFRAICFMTRFLKGGWMKHAHMQKV